MRHRTSIAALAAAVALAGAVALAAPASSRSGSPSTAARQATVDDSVRLNEIQVVGSHNSYKRMVSDKEEALRRSFIKGAADQMQYQHEALPVQFQSRKVRQTSSR